MKENEVKKAVYSFVNEACEELDYWVVSMYNTNQFVLMDGENETPNEYTLNDLEGELKSKSSNLTLDPQVKKQALEHRYEYSDEDFN